ncbi:hypothetical protein JHK84_043876 [Glycine max]|nr:hypothetical protein JHK84_043876 [Glycine max]
MCLFCTTSGREVVLDYLKLSSKVARNIVEVLIGKLGVEPDASNIEGILGLKKVTMNYYPACQNPEFTVGAGRHSNMGTLTVLFQYGIGGLYVKVEPENDDDAGNSTNPWSSPTEKIGPLPELVKKDGLARYTEVVYNDYLNNFFGNALARKKSLDFARFNFA